ncbi:diaminopimelate decarboxylase, partial [Mycobacteroides chelonae]
MSAHPAGPRHAEGEQHTAMSSAPPVNPTELAPNVWPRNASRGANGEVTLAGLTVSELAEEYGTPLFVIDEDDFRSRCRDMAAAFGGAARVHYASKAFLCTEIARWIKDEG